jgi:hypothetical protein
MLLLASCAGSEAPTGIVVEVDTDLAVPSAADGIRVQVRNDQGASLYELNVDLRPSGPANQLPGRLALQPEDPGRPSSVAIEATALRAGKEVLRQEARLTFRPGVVVLLKMPLLAGCACQHCGAEETCTDGAHCESVARDVNALPLYVPGGTGKEARPAPTSCPVTPEGMAPDASAPDAQPRLPSNAALPTGFDATNASVDAGVEAPVPAMDGAPPMDGGTPTLPLGAACGSGAQCGSGACADGVCCSSACGAICMACAKILTGQPDGQCAPVQVGTDPRADCAADAPTSCRYDGTCDGAGACRLYLAGTLCGPPTCSVEGYSPASRCTGSGVCSPELPQPCVLFACTLDRGCLTGCQEDTDCVADAYCATGDCAARKGKGEPCASDRECLSHLCPAGRCVGKG